MKVWKIILLEIKNQTGKVNDLIKKDINSLRTLEIKVVVILNNMGNNFVLREWKKKV